MLDQTFILHSGEAVRVTNIDMTRFPPYQPVYTMSIISGDSRGKEIRLTNTELFSLNGGKQV